MSDQDEIEDCIAEYAGMRIKAKCLAGQGIYLCPVCLSEGHTTMFYTAKDLLHHIRAHAEGLVHIKKSEQLRHSKRTGTLMGLGRVKHGREK